jgi:hypothetical protein
MAHPPEFQPLSNAISKSKERQARAVSSALACSASGITIVFKTQWSEFLVSHNGVFSVFEQGAKGHRKTAPWFGRIKHARRKDEMLHYLHMARNADEHGLDCVVQVTARRTVRAIDGSMMRIERLPDDQYGPVFDVRGQAPLTMTNTPPWWIVAKVRDTKHGDEFEPPKRHLNADIPDPSPVNIARLANTYTQKLIDEAEDLLRSLLRQA